MAASVLFDAPGPATRRRHRLYTVGFAAVFLAVLTWVVLKLNAAGQFDPEIYRKLSQPNIWNAITDGLVATVKAAFLSIVLAVVLGFLLATGRLSDHALIRWPSRAIVEFFRAVPVVLLMLFFYSLSGGHGFDSDLRAFWSVVLGLVLYNGSVLAEVFRAGIRAVPKGQSEAAYAIGLRKTQVMTLILTPQAVRFMLPAIISQCVVALKDTSLGFVVAYLELLREGKLIAQFVNNELVTYALIAVIYITLNSIVSALAGLLERRMARRGRTKTAAGTKAPPALPEDGHSAAAVI